MALRALCGAAAVAMAGAQTSNWLTDHDYSLEDLNPASATYGEEVGPTYFPCVAALRRSVRAPPQSARSHAAPHPQGQDHDALFRPSELTHVVRAARLVRLRLRPHLLFLCISALCTAVDIVSASLPLQPSPDAGDHAVLQ